MNEEIKLSANKYSKLFWNEMVFDPDSTRYNIQFAYHIKGELDKDKMISALRNMVRDTALLRSYFKTDEDEKGLTQYISNSVNDAISYKDLSSDKTKVNLHQYTGVLLNSSFKLDTPPLVKFELLKLAENEFLLSLMLHHILIDGNYSNSFLSDLCSYYNNPEKNGESVEVCSISERYADELSGFNEVCNSADYLTVETEAFEYWKNSFRSNDVSVDLSSITNVSSKCEDEAGFEVYDLKPEIYDKIINLSNSNKISLFLIFECGLVYSSVQVHWFKQCNSTLPGKYAK